MSGSISKAIALIASGKFSQKLVGLLALIFYGRMFTLDDLAIIPYYAMVSELLVIFFGFGIQTLIIKDLPQRIVADMNSAQKLLAISNKLQFILAAFILIIGFVLVQIYGGLPGLRTLNKYASFILVVAMAFETISIVKDQELIAAKKYRFMTWLGLFKSIIRPIAIIGSYYLFNMTGIAIGHLISILITIVVLHVVYKKENLYGEHKATLSDAINYLATGIPFYFESMVMFLRRKGDEMLVTWLLNPAALALYFLSKRMIELLGTFVSSADAVITPLLTKNSGNYGYAAKIIPDLVKLGVYISLPLLVGALSFTPTFLAVVLNKYDPVAEMLTAVLCLRVVPDVVRGLVIGRSLLAFCDPVVRFQFTALDAVCLIILSYSLITIFGLGGVAVSPLVAALISGVYGYYKLNEKIELALDIKRIFIATMIFIVSVGLGYMTGNMTDNTYLRSTLMCLTSAISYGLLFFLLLGKSEILWLVSMLKPGRKVKSG